MNASARAQQESGNAAAQTLQHIIQALIRAALFPQLAALPAVGVAVALVQAGNPACGSEGEGEEEGEGGERGSGGSIGGDGGGGWRKAAEGGGRRRKGAEGGLITRRRRRRRLARRGRAAGGRAHSRALSSSAPSSRGRYGFGRVDSAIL